MNARSLRGAERRGKSGRTRKDDGRDVVGLDALGGEHVDEIDLDLDVEQVVPGQLGRRYRVAPARVEAEVEEGEAAGRLVLNQESDDRVAMAAGSSTESQAVHLCLQSTRSSGAHPSPHVAGSSTNQSGMYSDDGARAVARQLAVPSEKPCQPARAMAEVRRGRVERSTTPS